MSEEMAAGAEMDAMVAEHVLGWRRETLYDQELNPDYVLFGGDVPPYSTDIAAAWAVVERLRELGYALDLEDRWRFGEDRWYAALTAIGCEHRHDGYASGETVALAICRAAILATQPTTARPAEEEEG